MARGRPRLPPDEGKRHAVGIRTTKQLKDLLQRAADSSGRSIAQEIEFRLENSFREEDQSQLAGLLMTLEKTMRDAGMHAGFISTGSYQGALDWFENPTALREAVEGAREVLQALRPKEGPAHDLPAVYANLGQKVARGVLEALRNPERGGGIGTWAAPVRLLLSGAAVRLDFDDGEVILSAIEPGAHQPSVLARLSKEKPERPSRRPRAKEE